VTATRTNLRLPRTALLGRLTDPAAPIVTLVEAPIGFGKSWLLRRGSPPGAVRLRGELGALSHEPLGHRAVVIDDAHQLEAEEVRTLVERIEDAPTGARLTVAGRFLPEPLHEVTHLLDGQILDTSSLAISADEIVAAIPELAHGVADQVVQAADGCVKLISTALDQWGRQPSQDPAALVAHLSRTANAAALHSLDPADRVLVGLLARTPGIDQMLLASLGDVGFVWRALDAGIPLRRQVSGELDVLGAAFYRAHDIGSETATRLATALAERDRPLEAAGLLLDAGEPDKAARMLLSLPESVTKSVEPRAMLGILSRLGTVTDSEPGLLLLRANGAAQLGRLDQVVEDVDRAAALVRHADPPVRRRVEAAVARTEFFRGRRERAIELAISGLRDIGPGEEHTFARAHEVLALATAASETRDDLQLAAESFRVAAAAWDACGESALARNCRCDLAMAVLIPLGRFDEALAVLGQVLSVAGLNDAERSWLLTCEGFALLEANRLATATGRFDRVADLGYLQDNSTIVALAAWGRALIAARENDLPATLRWISTAENTALGDADDLLGVSFLCDVSTVLGALGELALAERYLRAAESRPKLYDHDVRRARFVFEARRGNVGDVDAQLAVTRPAEWWRVLLVAALGNAHQGNLGYARELHESAERELLGLGFAGFASLGEGRSADELQQLLQRGAPAAASEPVSAAERALTIGGMTAPPARLRIRVIGGPMLIEDGDDLIEVPTGNPQRLLGVVVAHDGVATFDQLAEAMWPGDDVETSRARLRNVLLRLRRGVGEVTARFGSGVRLAQGVSCDLFEFERLANDALASARTDPELAGRLAAQAVGLVEGPVLRDFEYEEWALSARRAVDHRMIGLLDLLSVQAEDAGDLPRAQALAERALRLDRYTDSRYVRLAELLTMQGRSAAAVAVLEDAAELARELGAAVPKAAKRRRDELIRRAANG
jgi:DNA-binding SARP family transcriptional activator